MMAKTEKKKVDWTKYSKKYIRPGLKYLPEEWEIIKKNSENIGISPATFIKSVSLNYRSKLIPRPSKTDAKTLAQIRKMGVNLNQIAKICNQKKEIDNSVLAEIQMLLKVFGGLEEHLE